MMGIPLAHVFGDSQVIINWAKGSTALSPPELIHWCRETKKLVTSFKDLSFSHIYREHNKTADRLSKKALSLPQGKGWFMEFDENILVFKDHIQLFWACFWGLPLSVDPLATCMCFFQVCSGLFTLDMQLSITRKCFLLECWTEFYWLSIDVIALTVLTTWWDSYLMGIVGILCHSSC